MYNQCSVYRLLHFTVLVRANILIPISVSLLCDVDQQMEKNAQTKRLMKKILKCLFRADISDLK